MKNVFCLLAHELTENGRISFFCWPVIMMMHHCLLSSTQYFTAGFLLPIKSSSHKTLERSHPLLIFRDLLLMTFFSSFSYFFIFLRINKKPFMWWRQNRQGTHRIMIKIHLHNTGTSYWAKEQQLGTLGFIFASYQSQIIQSIWILNSWQ